MLTGKKRQDSTSFAKLFEETSSRTSFAEGQIVKGKVVGIHGREAIIDIGYKSEGILDLEEFVSSDAVRVGDEIEVLFEKLDDDNGMAIVSKRKADRQKCWDQLRVFQN